MVDLDLSDSEFLFEGYRCQLFLQLDDNAVSEAFVMNQIAFSYFTLFLGFLSSFMIGAPSNESAMRTSLNFRSACLA